jgi:hypothetical protein
LNTFFPNLKENFALHYVEPLFLIVMEVQRRSARNEVGVLEEEKVPASLLRGDFERDMAETEGAVLAIDVLACEYDVCFFYWELQWLSA